MPDVLLHLRSDARDNRDRILEVAREVFAADGLDVPMREIARRAEVGPATLYRHFPTKENLVTVAFQQQMRACTTIVDEGLADPDPWRGFRTVIERVCELHALDRGFTAAFISAFPKAIDFAGAREDQLAKLATLSSRAIRAGTLRPDFVMDDLYLLIMANSGIRGTTPAATLAAARRFAALMIQSFRVQPLTVPLPPAARLGLTRHQSSSR
ncbi:TetR/AcrR family transcriptional regulator [Actinoplanes sp. NPDC051494]|uniref:TetR/AcrR family transcriptional regulator n=1 Tax=Actinoplanes sp. NPDC051494 TaxID=3363907 RepID=UPI0037B4C876